MHELRWNPLLGNWVIVASNRQHRPHLPSDYCPFCPSHNQSLPDYKVLIYDNDFPALSINAPISKHKQNPKNVFQNKRAYGKCEVVLYSPDHNKEFYQLTNKNIEEIILAWKSRTETLSEDKQIKYVYPFENRGVEVGVTIHHPHGQIYAYPFIPPKIKTELTECEKHYKVHSKNLFDDLVQAEKKHRKRIVFENKGFIALIPYFTDYPFGVFVIAKRKVASLKDFNDKEARELAEVLKAVTKGFDRIYDRKFPYIMAVHQSPVNSPVYRDVNKYYRFHIEFYPPLRAVDKIKWYAGSEMGAGVAANPLNVDECAAILRKKIKRR